MPRKKDIDMDKLYTMIKGGAHASEIKSEFGIATTQQLKAIVFDLSMKKDEVIKLVGGRGRATGNRKINKTGIIIPQSQLVPPFKVGDEFRMSIDGDTIKLTKI